MLLNASYNSNILLSSPHYNKQLSYRNLFASLINHYRTNNRMCYLINKCIMQLINH